MLSGKRSVVEVARKWEIGGTYAYKPGDRAMQLLRNKAVKLALGGSFNCQNWHFSGLKIGSASRCKQFHIVLMPYNKSS